jgi:hypothetical protein
MTNQTESQWGEPGGDVAPGVGAAGAYASLRPAYPAKLPITAKLLITAVVLATTPACGTTGFTDDAGAAVVGPTLGHAELSPDEDGTATGDSVSTSTETTSPADDQGEVVYTPPGPPLEPLSSAELIRQAVEDAHGPTDDVAGQMSRFVDFPDLPTPEGAEIVELRADVRDTLDGSSILVTAEVAVVADGTVEELAKFYEIALGPYGWLPSSASDHLVGSGGLQRRGFAIPGTTYELDDLTIELADVSPASSGASVRSEVRLRYVELVPAGENAIRQRLEGWAADLPLPAGGTVTGAGIQTTSLGRLSLFYSLALRYDDVGAEAVATELRSLLPTDAYAIDPQPQYGDKLDNWVYLTSPHFADSRISTHQAVAEPDAGPTLVNVDARVEFETP